MKSAKRPPARKTKPDLFDAAKLETFIIGFLGDRLAKMGEYDSGLFSYYRYFVEKNIGFAFYDAPIAKFLKGQNGRFARGIDVGAGVGQL
jgi:hypothetical protein